MLHKPLDQIENSDIEALVENAVCESKTLEFKQELPGNSDKDKKEFLADVSSFANAAGGDIIYGIAETKARQTDDITEPEAKQATSICGLSRIDEDNTILRLNRIVLDGIEPRIPGVQMEVIEGFKGGPVLIIRVPKSWCGPHRVKASGRFLCRQGSQKYDLDMAQLRSAFEGSGDIAKRIRDWRDERLGRIIAGETPVPLSDPARLAVHLVPLEAMSNPWRFEVGELKRASEKFKLFDAERRDRPNLDGWLIHDRANASQYTQVFRSAQVEAVNTGFIRGVGGTEKFSGTRLEKMIVDWLRPALQGMRDLDVQPPCLFSLTLLNAKGACLETGFYREDGSPIDRDVLCVPEVLIDDFGSDISTVMRPAFDAIWNACGFSGSESYDSEGKWNPDSR